MTEADRMLQAEGYKKEFGNDAQQIYRKKKSSHTSHMIFNLNRKSIEVARYNEYGMHQNKEITRGQLKAMLKKMEELGWI